VNSVKLVSTQAECFLDKDGKERSLEYVNHPRIWNTIKEAVGPKVGDCVKQETDLQLQNLLNVVASGNYQFLHFLLHGREDGQLVVGMSR
jgi:hypothetical protein